MIKSADDYFAGITSLNNQDYNKAVEDFSKAITHWPSLPHPYLYRAWAYDQMKMEKEALVDLNTVISDNPQYTNAYMVRGLIYDSMGDLNKAAVDYYAVINLIDYHKNIKVEARNAGKFSGKEKWYHIDCNYEDPEILANEFRIYACTNPRIVDHYNTQTYYASREDNSSNPFKGVQGDKKLTKEFLKFYMDRSVKSVFEAGLDKINDSFKPAFDLMSRISTKINYQYQILISKLSIVSHPTAYFLYGFAAHGKGSFDDALLGYNEAIKVDSKYKDAYYYRAIINAHKNNIKPAIADAEEFLRIAAESPLVKDMTQLIEELKNRQQ